MKERLAFAATAASVTVFSALWTFSPVSRLLSKVLPNPDNGLTWDYLWDFFVRETGPRAAVLVVLVASLHIIRELKPKLAWLLVVFILPIIWTTDMILWIAQ